MSGSIGRCDAQAMQFEGQLEDALGVRLPDCASARMTEGGGIVFQTDDSEGTSHVVEIEGDGAIYRSKYCGRGAGATVRVGGRTIRSCRTAHRIREGSVDPSKLRKARDMLLSRQSPKLEKELNAEEAPQEIIK